MKNKKLLITGGTGSFGNAVLKKFIESDVSEIRIFSRDEKKQDDMRKKYRDERIKYYIGDVRDYRSILNAIRGIDFVFHAAALKQVPSCEFHPMEAYKTNVAGTENLLEASISVGVKKVVCLSTDKAVYPINAMGISKAMMEKVAISKAAIQENTVISITRYGNVVGSRGSVIPLFLNQIANNLPITITDPKMTRFMMTLDEAVELVLFSFKNATPGQICVQKSHASSLDSIARAVLSFANKADDFSRIIGTRHGEKLHEVLMTREEMSRATDHGNYFTIPPDMRDLRYDKFYELGDSQITNSIDYNSLNSPQLEAEELLKLIKLCSQDAV